MQNTLEQRTIYLDHAAATPLSNVASTAITAHLDAVYGNPSSIHTLGRVAYDVRERARTSIASALQVAPSELIFTGSGTESANLALMGLARAHRAHGNHIIVSSIEHKAVLGAAKELEKEGFVVTYVPVDMCGRISMTRLSQALSRQTTLVSVMYANNEIGTIQPISDIANMLRTYRGESTYPLFHTDACQTVGMLPVLPPLLGVDAMTINSSKIYGPKGVGLLYLKNGTRLAPCIVGGDQEAGRRAGTENVALIAGFAAALSEAVRIADTHAPHLTKLREFFIAELYRAVPGIMLNGHETERLPNNVHVTIPDVEGESLVLLLSEKGIFCATGSACSSRDLMPSHVLRAIGQRPDVIHGSLRFTLGRSTTKEELAYAATQLGAMVTHLRHITACSTRVYARVHSNI